MARKHHKQQPATGIPVAGTRALAIIASANNTWRARHQTACRPPNLRHKKATGLARARGKVTIFYLNVRSTGSGRVGGVIAPHSKEHNDPTRVRKGAA